MGLEGMSKDRIVAIGLLTSLELEMLGERFNRFFPVEQDSLFDDLLIQLDQVEATPLGKGVAPQRKPEEETSEGPGPTRAAFPSQCAHIALQA